MKPSSLRLSHPALLSSLGIASALLLAVLPVRAEFKAGAAAIEITPTRLPVLINGSMTSRAVDTVHTRIHARAVALADGKEQLVIAVVDSCMMTRALLDEAKALAEKRTGIPSNRLLISATHAHSVPSSMGCLGTDADPAYVPFLRDKLVEAIVAAQAALEPARVGFARAHAADFTAVRRWIRRPDRLAEDPFGNKTVRANMRAGPWKLYLALPNKFTALNRKTAPSELALYDVRHDVGEEHEVAAQNPAVVERLLAMAERARADVGDMDQPGAGQRPAGIVEAPKALVK